MYNIETASIIVFCRDVNGEFKCLFLRSKKHFDKQGRALWVIPGGKVEEGETPLQTAVRELNEECRIDLGSESHRLIYFLRRDDPNGDIRFVKASKLIGAKVTPPLPPGFDREEYVPASYGVPDHVFYVEVASPDMVVLSEEHSGARWINPAIHLSFPSVMGREELPPDGVVLDMRESCAAGHGLFLKLFYALRHTILEGTIPDFLTVGSIAMDLAIAEQLAVRPPEV